MRALVVDDLAYNRRSLRAIFQSAGYDVESASDGPLDPSLVEPFSSMVNTMQAP